MLGKSIIMEEVIDFFERELNNDKIPFLVFEAPTGYGKTSMAPYLLKPCLSALLAIKSIHVLPMRSLVEKIYNEALMRKTFEGIHIDKEDVGYQASSDLGEGKSPIFLKKFIYSTFDSFTYNIFKLSVSETWKQQVHYEVPRGCIFSSMIGLDEAHLYGGDPGTREGKTFSTFLSVISSLATSLVPTYILSATLPKSIIYSISRRLKDIIRLREIIKIKEIILDIYPESISNNIELKNDKDYFSKTLEIRWRTEVAMNEEDFKRRISYVIDQHTKSSKILIIRNTPEKAVETYEWIKESSRINPSKVILMHGRLCSKDRLNASNLLDSSDVIVATQVVEAGINIKKAMWLFTDIAPPTSLAQRIGRLARFDNEDEGNIVIAYGNGDGVYDEKIVSDTFSIIHNICENDDEKIDWRTPTLACKDLPNKRVSYKIIIEKVYKDVSVEIDRNLKLFLNSLNLIDRDIAIASKEVRRLESRLCSLTRESFMLPLYVGYQTPSNLDQLNDYILTCNFNWLSNRWKDIIKMKNNNCIVLVNVGYEEGEDLCEAMINTSIFNSCENVIKLLRNPGRHIRSLTGQSFPRDCYVSFLAFVCKEHVYQEGIGLIL